MWEQGWKQTSLIQSLRRFQKLYPEPSLVARGAPALTMEYCRVFGKGYRLQWHATSFICVLKILQ